MHQEVVLFGQVWIGNSEDKNPRWEDVVVPTLMKAHLSSPPSTHSMITDPTPVREENVTVGEWGTMLARNGATGTFRAFTNQQRRVSIIVTTETAHRWEAREE